MTKTTDPLETAFHPVKDNEAYNVSPALAKENLLERNKLHKLPNNFYKVLKENISEMNEENAEITEGHMNSLFRLRQGKIIELAGAGASPDDFYDFLSFEENVMFVRIADAATQCKKAIMKTEDKK